VRLNYYHCTPISHYDDVEKPSSDSIFDNIPVDILKPVGTIVGIQFENGEAPDTTWRKVGSCAHGNPFFMLKSINYQQ